MAAAAAAEAAGKTDTSGDARFGTPHEVDPCSLGNSTEVRVEHIAWYATVDFGSKTLQARADLTVIPLKPEYRTLVLDTSALDIQRVTCYSGAGEAKDAEPVDQAWELAPESAPFGRALKIQLPAEPIESMHIVVHYATTTSSTAIQWLEPAQTAGKVHPFLFTQCQAIHARALLPCHDVPGAKAGFEAHVTVPAPYTALVSAESRETDADGRPLFTATDDGKRTFHYAQKRQIPSYLIALAVGDLAFRPTSDYTGVWAEPAVVDAAAYEFAEMESMVAAGSSITGVDYRSTWGRYDVLCMPPSFPYGGMENPCITFVTPTLLAGDRSLATVVIHEISHSWTGNLVTNQTWKHFWLNEGWTMFLQRKIIAALSGLGAAQLDLIVGQKALADSVSRYGADHEFTKLLPDLGGVDPDDSFSSVPYEKGCEFLLYLEHRAGGPEAFAGFLQAYVQRFADKTINSAQFKQLYIEHFGKGEDLEWDAFLLEPGHPEPWCSEEYLLGHAMPLKKAIDDLAAAWISGDGAAGEGEGARSSADVEGWKTAQFLGFLNLLDAKRDSLSADLLRRMDALYNFSSTGNAEIRFRWQKLCIFHEMPEIIPAVVQFATEQGRMKFTRPLYRMLYQSQMGRDVAVTTFVEHRNSYHPICAKMVARDLELDG